MGIEQNRLCEFPTVISTCLKNGDKWIVYLGVMNYALTDNGNFTGDIEFQHVCHLLYTEWS